MLGIRRYRGVAIDLWQGESRLFARDVTAQPSLASLREVDRQQRRHAAIDIGEQPGAEVSAAAALAAVKAFLDEARPEAALDRAQGIAQPVAGGLRRISFVLPDAARYTAFQEELFRLFPEEDL